jgi:hypothetical protein
MALLAFRPALGPDYARMRTLLRAFVTLATFVVVWLVASPAQAAAPVCDPRGAIMFAPPPQMQDPEQSLDVVAPCDPREDPFAARHVGPQRGPQIEIVDSREPALTTAIVIPLSPPLARIAAPEEALARAPSGVRSALERPPRG